VKVPRAIDLPTPVLPDEPLDRLDEAKILAAPDDPALWPAWRERLAAWRGEAAARIGYDGSLYGQGEFSWTSSCYSICLAWLWDEALYDHATHRFTPDAFLDAGEAEFGGHDAVVLWHAYPVIGIDDRNQFDYYRQAPGLADLIAAFHRRGVRVFLDYNPWDTGTRREPADDAAVLAALVRELAADGVFLDTRCCRPGWRWRVSRGCRWPGSTTITCRGPSGSPTRRCPECCGPAGSSRGT